MPHLDAICSGNAKAERNAYIKHYAGIARYRRLRGMIVDAFRNGDLNFRSYGNAIEAIKYLAILVPNSIRHAASHILSRSSS